MVIIQLTDSGAVGTFHVVGINLQFRLGIDNGAGAQAEIFIGQGGVSATAVFVNMYSPVKGDSSAAIANGVECLALVGVGCAMF